MTRRSSRTTRLYAPRTRGRTRSERLDRVGGRLVGQERGEELRVGAGGEAARARPAARSSSSRVFTRLPLCPIASARRGPRRSVGWAFSQTVEPVVE